MPRRTYTASSILLAAVLLFIQSGCREDASKWDATQEASQGKKAAESSRERLDNKSSATAGGQDTATKTGGEDLGEIPAFNPNGASTNSKDPIVWKPKEMQTEAAEPQVDLVSLVAGDPLPGSEFNKFFPVQSVTFDTVAKQEKSGFSQYSLRRDGDEIAQLSITDLRSNPEAAKKFQTPDMRVGNYPAKQDGTKGTTLLVAGRFQVKVRSPGGQLNQQDRISWLEKFNLSGIESLAN